MKVLPLQGCKLKIGTAHILLDQYKIDGCIIASKSTPLKSKKMSHQLLKLFNLQICTSCPLTYPGQLKGERSLKHLGTF